MAKDKGTRAPGGEKPTAGAAGPDVKIPDPVELSRTMGQIAERSQKLVAEFLRRQSQKPGMGMADPMNVGQAFLDMTARLMANPAQLVQAQLSLWQQWQLLLLSTQKRTEGDKAQLLLLLLMLLT